MSVIGRYFPSMDRKNISFDFACPHKRVHLSTTSPSQMQDRKNICWFHSWSYAREQKDQHLFFLFCFLLLDIKSGALSNGQSFFDKCGTPIVSLTMKSLKMDKHENAKMIPTISQVFKDTFHLNQSD